MLLRTYGDNLNNSKKVSSNILSNNSVETRVVEDKNNSINKCTKGRRQRPVYIGENPFNFISR